jgi:hypothetical protein
MGCGVWGAHHRCGLKRKGLPYHTTDRLARLVHSRGDGLSSPWGGVVALYRSPHHSHYMLLNEYGGVNGLAPTLEGTKV